MAKKHVVIPIFIPHRGCPHDCIFCNQKLISGQIKDVTIEEMQSTIEMFLSSIQVGTTMEIAFYGGSFTGIEKEYQMMYLQLAALYISQGRIEGIRLSTRPDYISEEILLFLQNYPVKTIELGVQSMDNTVLEKSGRGHTAKDVTKASALIKEFGFTLGIQTMIGLPGSSRENEILTAQRVIGLKPDFIRIYPTLVVKNTALEMLYQKDEYRALPLEEAVELCVELMAIYEKENIPVIRVGLQATEGINLNGDIVAGPFHAAFRQLVTSKRMIKEIKKMIYDSGLENAKGIKIICSPKFISETIGQNKENLKELKRCFGYENIIVKADFSLEKGHIIQAL